MAIIDGEDLERFPQFGWEYQSMIDLGAPVGSCNYCDTEIRYCHSIFHRNWGIISVGAKCADRLAMNNTASEKEQEYKKYLERLKRFLESKKWRKHKNGLFFVLEGYQIRIWNHERYCNLGIGYPVGEPIGKYQQYEMIKSRHRYESIEAAKRKVYRVIVNGTLKEYLLKQKIGR